MRVRKFILAGFQSAPNKVTIYRVLECLVRKGIVHKAYMKDRAAFYELGDNCSKTQ